MTRQLDYIQVGRKAHELSAAHGLRAYQYAAKLATQALVEGDTEGHEFWKHVEAALTPRQNSN
jgi:hypothetical protein